MNNTNILYFRIADFAIRLQFSKSFYNQYFGNLILNYFNRVDSLITPHPFGQATLARSPHFGA